MHESQGGLRGFLKTCVAQNDRLAPISAALTPGRPTPALKYAA